jgi:NAD(P)-dependent dehydrogenase (short-subunit alcohol dehydrogenase family)
VSDSEVGYYPRETLYGLSKHGMNALAEYILTEYGGDNIYSVAICPGLVRTAMGMGLRPVHEDALLTAEDIAEWIAFVLGQSDARRIRSPITLSTARDPWSGRCSV